MLLVHGRGKRTVVKSGADEVNRKAKAITATHLELLEHIKQREANAAPGAQK